MKYLLAILFLVLNAPTFGQSVQKEVLETTCCYDKDYLSEFEQLVFKDFLRGNTNDHAALLFAIDSSMTLRKFKLTDKYFKEYCEKLKNKRSQFHTDIAYLKYVFDVVQQYYLKEFQYNQSIDRIMFKGTFDCVAGTSFYALVLENIGFDFVIKETPLHVYLELYADGNKILLETTDKNGFIINRNKVVSLETQYASEASEAFKNLMKKSCDVDIQMLDNQIDMVQLAGIQYFNKASVAFTSHNYKQSLLLSQKAYLLYPSPRIKGLILSALELLMNNKQISYKTKLELYKKYRS